MTSVSILPAVGLFISLVVLVPYISVKVVLRDMKKRIAFLSLLVALFSLAPAIPLLFDVVWVFIGPWLMMVMFETLDIRAQVKRLEIVDNEREESIPGAESVSGNDVITIGRSESTLRTSVSIVLLFSVLFVPLEFIFFGLEFCLLILYIAFFSYLGMLYANASQQIDRMEPIAEQAAV